MSARAFLGSWRHYVLGALGVAAAFFVRSWLVREFAELPPFVIFYPVVFLVAAIGGTGPGLYTSALAGFVVDVWIFGPQGHSPVAPRGRMSLHCCCS